jgi:Fe-S-cluster-containing hydrogenase component 2
VDAIHGVIKKPYVIDHDACIKCGTCMMNCKFGAIAIKD